MDPNLDSSLESDSNSFITCRNSQSLEVRATPLRLTRYAVAFEVYNPYSLLQLSEVLTEFKIVINDRLVYSGQATVSSLVNTGLVLVCEAELKEEAWRDLNGSVPLGVEPRLQEGFERFIRQWQRFYKVRPEFKVVVADLQTFLADLRHWLEQVEFGIRSSPSEDRAGLEREVLEQLAPATTEAVGSLFERFEELPSHIEPSLQPAHRAFARRQLHPLLLCSPFVYRTFQKPLGYAGDYEMVNMIWRDPLEGSSLFAKAVNLWFLLQPPAQAHRNRIRYLQSRLEEETRRVAAAGRRARILNLGCGPAIEVQNFLNESDLSDQAAFTLLDFNEETLQHVRSVLAQIQATRRRNTAIELVRKSVHQLLKEAGKQIERPPEQQYDMVYCAGLFDYLSDPVCQRLMNVLYQWVAPGGVLLATNVDRSNPRRHTMEYVLEWHLTYRDLRQLAGLVPEQAPPGCFVAKSDPTRVNLYLEVRKPRSEPAGD